MAALTTCFGYNGPTQMTTRIFHKPEISSEETLAAFDEIVREVQEKGISDSELEQLKVKWRSDYFATLEGGRGGYMPKYGLMHLLAVLHAVRQRTATGQHHSRRISGRHRRNKCRMPRASFCSRRIAPSFFANLLAQSEKEAA